MQFLVLTVEVTDDELLSQQIGLLKGAVWLLGESVHQDQLSNLGQGNPFCFFDLDDCIGVQSAVGLIGMVG